MTKRTESRDLSRYLHIHVDSSIIHSSQKVKTIRVSIDGWMDKQNVVHPYTRMLISLEKEGNSHTCYNMDEAWKHYAKKQKKSNTKGQILYNST